MTGLVRICILLLLALAAPAAVSLPYLIADHMVVQRNLPVHIWGKADPGEAIAVVFRGVERATVTDTLGRWSVYLPPGDPGGPFDLVIRAANTIVLHDI